MASAASAHAEWWFQSHSPRSKGVASRVAAPVQRFGSDRSLGIPSKSQATYLALRLQTKFQPLQSNCFRLLFIVLELSQAGQFAKDPLDQLRNGILEQK